MGVAAAGGRADGDGGWLAVVISAFCGVVCSDYELQMRISYSKLLCFFFFLLPLPIWAKIEEPSFSNI